MVDAVNDVLLYKEAFEVSHQRLAAVADQSRDMSSRRCT